VVTRCKDCFSEFLYLEEKRGPFSLLCCPAGIVMETDNAASKPGGAPRH
jgi:hypothetical protein